MVMLLGLVCSCDNESTVEQRSNCFGACLSASATVDLDGQLAISADLRDSFELARVGLGTYVSAARSLTGFVQAMVDLNPSMPSGLTFQGSGLYTAKPNADTRVELRFYQASDTSFGVAGDLIDFNLFDAANYFASLGVKTSATIDLSGVHTSLSLTFDSAGKGAELLGLPAAVKSPIAVDVNGYSAQLSKVIVHANVVVGHASEAADIAFTVGVPAVAVAAVGTSPIALDVANFIGQGFEFGQVLALTSVDLDVRDAGGAYDGALLFSSTSASFDFKILLSYYASSSADIVFGCPDANLTVP
jgi:hypothetical protein